MRSVWCVSFGGGRGGKVRVVGKIREGKMEVVVWEGGRVQSTQVRGRWIGRVRGGGGEVVGSIASDGKVGRIRWNTVSGSRMLRKVRIDGRRRKREVWPVWAGLERIGRVEMIGEGCME